MVETTDFVNKEGQPLQPGEKSYDKRTGCPVQTALADQVKLWATPQAHDLHAGSKKSADRPKINGGQANLCDDVMNWPTPAASDVKGFDPPGKKNTRMEASLYFRPGQETSTPGGESSKSTRRLNPRFVEWLMGWPIGHSACDCPATEWSRWRRRTRTRLSALVCSTPSADTITQTGARPQEHDTMENESGFKIVLRASVTDNVTGFSGVVIGRVEYLTGCRQYMVAPRCKNSSEWAESRWFDEDRLLTEMPETPQNAGGPQTCPAPSK